MQSLCWLTGLGVLDDLAADQRSSGAASGSQAAGPSAGFGAPAANLPGADTKPTQQQLQVWCSTAEELHLTTVRVAVLSNTCDKPLGSPLPDREAALQHLLLGCSICLTGECRLTQAAAGRAGPSGMNKTIPPEALAALPAAMAQLFKRHSVVDLNSIR